MLAWRWRTLGGDGSEVCGYVVRGSWPSGGKPHEPFGEGVGGGARPFHSAHGPSVPACGTWCLVLQSDPFVVVLLRDPSSGHVRELGRTEVICNTLNPVFVKPIPMVSRRWWWRGRRRRVTRSSHTNFAAARHHLPAASWMCLVSCCRFLMIIHSASGMLACYPQTYKFEEVQHLIFRVYDVDTFYPVGGRCRVEEVQQRCPACSNGCVDDRWRRRCW